MFLKRDTINVLDKSCNKLWLRAPVGIRRNQNKGTSLADEIASLILELVFLFQVKLAKDCSSFFVGSAKIKMFVNP